MQNLTNIQILRAVAAMNVVIYHLGLEANSVCTAASADCSYDLTSGTDGVMLFFMISGFIMITTCWDSFKTKGSAAEFLYRRIARVVPLYWTVTTLVIVAVWLIPSSLNEAISFNFEYIASSYLFVPMARPGGVVWPIANLGWTLNLEMFFYVVFAVSLNFSRRIGITLTVSVLAALACLRLCGLFSAESPLSSVPLNFWGDPSALNFVIGMVVGIAYKRGFRVSGNLATGLVLATLVLTFWLVDVRAFAEALPKTGLANRLVYSIPVFPLFLLGALGRQLDDTKPYWRVLLVLGNASYSLYLFHPLVLRALRGLWMKLVSTQLPVWSFMAVGLMLALAVGLSAYILFERPMTRFFSRKNAPRARATLAGSAT